MARPLCLCLSDVHLRHSCPIARTTEPSWYEAMARTLDQVRRIVVERELPVLCAGDVFDKWNPPPELINFAVKNLPKMLSITGQHDLPYHEYEGLNRTAFATLSYCGKFWGSDHVTNLSSAAKVWSFPWGRVVERPSARTDVKIALIHSLVWRKGYGFVGAPSEKHIGGWKEALEGYDFAVFGDNHKPFTAKVGRCRIVNCGCLIPQSINEAEIDPSVWVLYDNGHVERIKLDTSKDRWIETRTKGEEGLSEESVRLLEGFVEGVEGITTDTLSFRTAVERAMRELNVSQEVSRCVYRALEGVK